MTVIHWFRRDLRLTDNTALSSALASGKPVIPVFIFDPAILGGRFMATSRMAFLLACLRSLDDNLHKHGSQLHILHGNPLSKIRELVESASATALYFNNDYTPYAVTRDREVEETVHIPVHRYDDALIMPPGSLMTNAGKPYTVYTPFKNKWRERSSQQDIQLQKSHGGTFAALDDIETPPIPTLAELNFQWSGTLPDGSENTAQKHLDLFLDTGIVNYSESRNQLLAEPFSGSYPTSQLSPYFRFGLLSPRQAIGALRNTYKATSETNARESINIWVDELIWREFYMHIMAHFPHVYSGNFRHEYDNLAWENNATALTAWKNGETGYPIVDAAMRQLKATGWMPNRARMIVASFLTKDLLINWREGEEHFMQHLLDGDPAANNGGWQWAAGTGTDAQPYFRIFNPVSQSQKYDPDGTYIRHWIPELANLDSKNIHAPWEMKSPPANYPVPIVNHKIARERTIEAFKAVGAIG